MTYKRSILDLAMIALMPLLMAFALTGFGLHELLGTILFVLVILHNILNRSWYAALFRGRLTAGRAFGTAVNLCLVLAMVLLALSGYTLTGRLSLPLHAARRIHLIVSYWSFVLMCLHAGIHLRVPFDRLRAQRPAAARVLTAALCAAALWGLWAFVRQGYPGYMFGAVAFADFDLGSPLRFFGELAGIMVLFMLLGALGACLPGRKTT